MILRADFPKSFRCNKNFHEPKITIASSIPRATHKIVINSGFVRFFICVFLSANLLQIILLPSFAHSPSADNGHPRHSHCPPDIKHRYLHSFILFHFQYNVRTRIKHYSCLFILPLAALLGLLVCGPPLRLYAVLSSFYSLESKTNGKQKREQQIEDEKNLFNECAIKRSVFVTRSTSLSMVEMVGGREGGCQNEMAKMHK